MNIKILALMAFSILHLTAVAADFETNDQNSNTPPPTMKPIIDNCLRTIEQKRNANELEQRPHVEILMDENGQPVAVRSTDVDGARTVVNQDKLNIVMGKFSIKRTGGKSLGSLKRIRTAALKSRCNDFLNLLDGLAGTPHASSSLIDEGDYSSWSANDYYYFDEFDGYSIDYVDEEFDSGMGSFYSTSANQSPLPSCSTLETRCNLACTDTANLGYTGCAALGTVAGGLARNVGVGAAVGLLCAGYIYSAQQECRASCRIPASPCTN